MEDRNALDCALVDLAAASTALERSARPNLKDVEEARDRAKKAHGILDASHKLMSVGIYTVADAPVSPGTPLPFPPAQPDAQVVPTGDPLPTLAYTDAEVVPTDEERTQQFEELLDKLETDGLEGGDLALKDWKKAEKDWCAAWGQDPKDTYGRLSFAVNHREPISWGIPTDEEMAAPGFVDPLEEGGEE